VPQVLLATSLNGEISRRESSKRSMGRRQSIPHEPRRARNGALPAGQGKCLSLASPVVSAAVAGLPLFRGDGYVTFRGTGTDRASGFRAGSTRNVAENGFREPAVDTDVLASDIT
jgi:hypothetical protein